MYQHPTHFLFPGTVASPQWRIDGCNHCAWPNHGGQSPQGSPGAAIAHHFEEWVEQGAHPIARNRNTATFECRDWGVWNGSIISWGGWFSERFGYLQLWGQDFFRSCSFTKLNWRPPCPEVGLRRRLTRYDGSLLWSANVEKEMKRVSADETALYHGTI